jgi:NAD+ diphosphatase
MTGGFCLGGSRNIRRAAIPHWQASWSPANPSKRRFAREFREEAGIEVDDVRYVASQPWPFPGSLMIACIADARSDELTIDTTELDDARWFSRPASRRLSGRARCALPGASAFRDRPHAVREMAFRSLSALARSGLAA